MIKVIAFCIALLPAIFIISALIYATGETVEQIGIYQERR